MTDSLVHMFRYQRVLTFTEEDRNDPRLRALELEVGADKGRLPIGPFGAGGTMHYVSVDELRRVEQDIVRRQALALLIPGYGQPSAEEWHSTEETA